MKSWNDYIAAAAEHRHEPVPVGWASASWFSDGAKCRLFTGHGYSGLDAIRGTACHQAIADLAIPDGAPADIRELIEWALEFRSELGGEQHAEVQMRDQSMRVSGRADLISETDQQVTIVDWKTGETRYDDARTGQMLALAALVPTEQHIRLVIAMPRLRCMTDALVSHYDARLQTLATLTSTPPPLAGQQCRYCSRAPECSAIDDAVRAVSVPDIDQRLDSCDTVIRAGKSCEDMRRALTGDLAAGRARSAAWEIRETTKRAISDPARVFSVMVALGVPSSELQSRVRWSISDLHELGAAVGVDKRTVDDAISPFVTVETSQSLRRSK